MPISAKRKASNKKWDDANLRNGSYKMKIDLYKQFEKYCEDTGKSKNGLINELVSDKLKKEGYITK